MRALLDTHVFLWAAGPVALLSPTARGFIESEDNELLLSVVSLWEIQLKADKGLLLTGFSSPGERVEFLREQIGLLEIIVLSLEPSHVYALAGLPPLHRDPFDRLLIAQAMAAGVPLVSGDQMMRQYPLETIW